MEIKKIGAMSLAKIMAMIGIIWGFVLGVIVSILYFRLAATGNEAQISELISQAPAIAGIYKFGFIIFPIYYGLIAFISGLIVALLYNWIAKWLGGINIEFKK